MIKPTPGRIVWYNPTSDDPKPEGMPPKPWQGILAAIVTYVWSDRMVNLIIFDVNGGSFARTSVALLQEDELSNTDHTGCCEWMPYQKGQAAKTEALEKQIGV